MKTIDGGVIISLECGAEDRILKTDKTILFVQITYETVRTYIDGEDIDLMVIDFDGRWRVTDDFVKLFNVGDPNEWWSDIIIG